MNEIKVELCQREEEIEGEGRDGQTPFTLTLYIRLRSSLGSSVHSPHGLDLWKKKMGKHYINSDKKHLNKKENNQQVQRIRTSGIDIGGVLLILIFPFPVNFFFTYYLICKVANGKEVKRRITWILRRPCCIFPFSSPFFSFLLSSLHHSCPVCVEQWFPN